jgi:hypothetical protein
MLSLSCYHAPPTPIPFTETPPLALTPIRSAWCAPTAHPAILLPTLFSLAKSLLVIMRAKC